MARQKRIRVHQLAASLGLTSLEFKKHAFELGYDFRSTHNSLHEKEASALFEGLKLKLEKSKTRALEQVIADPHHSPCGLGEFFVLGGGVLRERPLFEEWAVGEPTRGSGAAEGADWHLGQHGYMSKPLEGHDGSVSGGEMGLWRAEADAGLRKVPVLFLFVHAGTLPGDHVSLSGELPELGGWDPERAVTLESDDWPNWKAWLALPEGVSFEYQLIVKNNSGVCWETGRIQKRISSERGEEPIALSI